MENVTLIYWDTQDSNNPGWAWRNDSASGEINNVGAAEFLRNTVNNESCTVSGRDALVSEMLSEGSEIESCYLSSYGFSDKKDFWLGGWSVVSNKAHKEFAYEFKFRRHRKSFAMESNIYGPYDAGTVCHRLLRSIVGDAHREHFYTLFLDGGGQLVGYEFVALGDSASVSVHPAEVFRGAIVSGAATIIVAHNHPSGRAEPSDCDWLLTHRLVAVGKLVGTAVVDHIVLGNPGFYSMVSEDPERFARNTTRATGKWTS